MATHKNDFRVSQVDSGGFLSRTDEAGLRVSRPETRVRVLFFQREESHAREIVVPWRAPTVVDRTSKSTAKRYTF
jgi:hypothetical protein